MPETLTIPETFEISAETVIDTAAAAEALAGLLVIVSGGDGPLVEAIDDVAARLIVAAFDDADREQAQALVTARGREKQMAWTSRLYEEVIALASRGGNRD